MKAQVAAEFVIVLVIALTIFLALFVVIDKKNDELSAKTAQLYAKAEAEKVAYAVNSVFLAGRGTTRSIELPDALKDGTDYNISVYPAARIVEINWVHDNVLRRYLAPILTSNVSNLTNISADISLNYIDGVVITNG